MATNDFVPFCNENTGTNLPTQSAYLSNPDLPLGNQPGIASSSLNNKALRQGTTIASVLAQYVCNLTGSNMNDSQNSADHVVPPALLGALSSALRILPSVSTIRLSGTGTHSFSYIFEIASGNATAAATYSDGTTTYTVNTTIASGSELSAKGNAVPAAFAGTLTKVSGTGDATITFYAYRKPVAVRIQMVGGGAGASGSGTTGPTGTAGGNTTFGTSLLVANGGSSTSTTVGGVGGTASLGTGPVGVALSGSNGGSGTQGGASWDGTGGNGGSSFFGGAGVGLYSNAAVGVAAAVNSGSGGGGSGTSNNASAVGGAGGGAGGYVDATITGTVLATLLAGGAAFAIGAAGTGGSTGTAGNVGGAGSLGMMIINEIY